MNALYKSTPLLAILSFFFILSACNKTDIESPLYFETDSIYGNDSSIYTITKIGNQWWMSENLNVQTYNNGDPIKTCRTNEEWAKDTLGAYCKYQNNSKAPGLLYNYYAINNSKGICPEGWHVSTDNDWKELELFIGMHSSEVEKSKWRGVHEGDKLKNTLGWNIDETIKWEVWATNEYNFSAQPSSCRLYNGTWGTGLQNNGFWWTHSEDTEKKAIYRSLDYKKSGIFRSSTYKNYGMSVRCVKN